MNRNLWRRFVALGVVLLLGSAAGVLAQEETGNVYAKVTDTNGDPLPGVTCELSGLGAPRIQVSNAAGEVRWLSLDPGAWALSCTLEGFSTVEYPNIQVRVGRNTSLEVALSEAIGEVITVTSESPLLDERRVATGTSVTQVELESIPTARDPWAVLSQTPGVLVDRINVGGNESGQQATFLGAGVSDDENTFMIDGIEVTDMAATGASPTYFDFDQYTEMQFTTGGSDITKSAAGVSVNLVTKRGTNEFRGSARFLRTDDSFFGGLMEQDTPVFQQPDDKLGEGQAQFIGNTINQVTEYGFEAGGPVLRDRLWFWGSFGTNDIKNRTGGATEAQVQPDDTTLENTAFKANWQIASPNSMVASWNNGDKKKFGRNAGPTRPQPTTWDQRGPTAVMKIEDTHVFSSSFFLSGAWSKVDGGFALNCKACIAAGGLEDTTESYLDENGVWQNSFWSGPSSRPSEELKIDGSYFFSGGGSHEIKFGGRLRSFESESTFAWPGRNLFMLDGTQAGFSEPGLALLEFARGDTPLATQTYTSLWVQDTWQRGNLTVNGGLRYDLQEGTNESYTVAGNPAFPEVLPDLTTDSFDAGFDWSDIQPRIGVTYALGEERSTLIRGNYSQFVEQLSTGDVLWTNALGSSYCDLLVMDNGTEGLWEPGIDTIEANFGCVGATPGETEAISPNRVDSGLSAPLTQEFTIGAEHSFIPEFVAGVNLIWRNTSDQLPGAGFTSSGGAYREMLEIDGVERPSNASDYVLDEVLSGELFDGSTYAAPRYALGCGVSCRTGGQLRENTDREVQYAGGSLYFTKRLSNQWMARGYFQYGQPEWSVGSGYVADYDPTNDELGGDVDGELTAIAAAGSGAKADVMIQSTWQWNLNGMYQVAPDRPWGFNIAANMFGREGYPNTQYRTSTGTDGVGRRLALTPDVDEYRVDDIFTMDFRLEKEFAAAGGVGFTFSIDIFNVFDEAYVMQRERRVNRGSYDYLRETLSPRVFRLGTRVSWR